MSYERFRRGRRESTASRPTVNGVSIYCRYLVRSCVVVCALASLTRGADAYARGGDLDGLSLEQLMDMNVHSVYGASKYEQRVTRAPSSERSKVERIT